MKDPLADIRGGSTVEATLQDGSKIYIYETGNLWVKVGKDRETAKISIVKFMDGRPYITYKEDIFIDEFKKGE